MPGFSVAERIEVIAPHPLARLKFDTSAFPPSIVGEPGEGFEMAMETLNLFRVTVGAAALGFARRALDEALAFATTRRLGERHARRQCGDPGQARRHGDWRSMPRRC